jgi:FkbM family methyltransferase
MDVSEFLNSDLTIEDVRQAYGWILGKAAPDEATITEMIPTYGSRRQFRRWLVASKAALHQNLVSRFGEEKWVATELENGRRIWLNLCDRHASMGCLIGEWEPNETRFMRDVVKPGHTVVDAGANLGWFSLIAADCVGSAGRVYAFEPQARIFRYLCRTIDDNALADRIRAYNRALSDRHECIGMTWDPRGANMGPAWLTDVHTADPALGLVAAVPLDEVVADTAIDFIKIDTEGAEMRVLTGARRTLERWQPILMVEIFPPLLRLVSRCEPTAIFQFLGDLGYAGFELTSGQGAGRFRPMPLSFAGNYRTAVFVPTHAVDAMIPSGSGDAG